MAKSAGRARPQDIGRMLHSKRTTEKITLDEVSKQTGISAATLSRLERQNETPNFTPGKSTLEAVAKWLGVFLGEENEVRKTAVPEVVELHLRADPKLEPADAEMLAGIFRKMYERFAKSEPDED